MAYTISEIAKIVNGSLISRAQNFSINTLSIDSRKIQPSDSSLFIAIEGDRHNAHDYIKSLINKGVKNFIVSQNPKYLNEQVNYIIVKNSLNALQKLAQYHRKSFNYPIIAITGSNGKTVVKEWLYYILKDSFNIVRSPKSYNSQVGVPLSVWQMTAENNLAIFEAGISKPREMEKLEEIISPTIGVITNIGDAHSENFTNENQKINEKLSLFKNCNLIIYNKDFNTIHNSLLNIYDQKKIFSWSKKKAADLTVKKIDPGPNGTQLSILFKKQLLTFEIPFTDSASIDNCITCIAIAVNLNVGMKILQAKLKQLSTIAMRMQLLQGKNNSVIINDSYNSDVNSLEIALDFLREQSQYSKKIVVLSDILQSRTKEIVLYKKVAEWLKNYRIDHFYGIGPALNRNKDLFKSHSTFFESTDQFLAQLKFLELKNASILLKGARPFNFEKICSALSDQTHDTTLNIDLNSLVSNLNYFKSKLNSGTKIMGMVKAFSYGTGSFEIANTLEFNRIDYLAVAYCDEGIALRNSGVKLPIMVMSPEKNTFQHIIEYNLEPEVYSLGMMKSFYKIALSHGLNSYPIHVKLDTGMHRLGFGENEIPELIDFLISQQLLKVKSVFTHLAASDMEIHDQFTHDQIDLFRKLTQKLSKALNHEFLKHVLNSAGIVKFPDYQFDMVRLGIGLYGISNDTSVLKNLSPVATLMTHITQIKKLKKGDTVSYGRKGKGFENMVIATIPIGYSDGLDRRFGNGTGFVLIGNRKAKIVGEICMDMTMIDVTDISVKEGEKVIIFGENPSILTLAKTINTIPYEILAGISRRVKRVYFQD